MSIRKRTWTTSKGENKSAWVVDYVDATGHRRHKTFERKKEADAFESTAKVEVRAGVHVADSASVTVEKAAKFWITSAEAAGLERTTIANYQTHIDLHIVPFLGQMKLSALNVPTIRSFEDQLREGGRTASTIKKVLVSLGSLLADSQERGLVGRNVVRELKGRRKGTEKRLQERHKSKLKVGVDIPSREDIKAFVGALGGRWRPLFLTAIFTGLRASELRGLKWPNVDFEKRQITVQQRADRFNVIGKPKSGSSERQVPMPPIVVNALKEWKLACPKGELDLVFPNGKGNVETIGNYVKRGLQPIQIASGITKDSGKKDEHGNAVIVAKYPGMHALRHFYASWLINRKEDGGLGLPPKVVQERMGHSSITLTMDRYGHLFPRGDDADELALAEALLLGS